MRALSKCHNTTLVLVILIFGFSWNPNHLGIGEVSPSDGYSGIPNNTVETNDTIMSNMGPRNSFLLTPSPLENKTMGLENNHPLFSNLKDHLQEESIRDNRPTSIIATYWATLLLQNLNESEYQLKKLAISTYVLGRFNPSTNHFEDPVDYSFYNQQYGMGASLLKAPYTPMITHCMGLILLAKMDMFDTISDPSLIGIWETELWTMQNIDYGFGNLHSPNSTIIETYFITLALLALHDFASGVFSPLQQMQIGTYLQRVQRTSDWAFGGIGAFSEYYENEFAGWENFLASWYATQIVMNVGINIGAYQQEFLNFLVDNSLFNGQKNCFYAEYNQRLQPQYATYYGTAIIGECVRILGLENQFTNLTDAQNTLVNATRFTQNNIAIGENYFYRSSLTSGNDLFNQYLVVEYLKNAGLLEALNDSQGNLAGLASTCEHFFTSSGGASYVPNSEISAAGEFWRSNYIAQGQNYTSNQINDVFSRIKARISVGNDHFIDHMYAATSPYYIGNMLIYPWNEWQHFPVATNYFTIQLLEDYNLFSDFINYIQMDYLDFEAWIADQYLAGGYFRNDTRNALSGNLESTYYALLAQNLLITHDTGQSFDYYYSESDLQTILDYANSFIVETASHWYGSANGSVRNAGLHPYEMTRFIVAINEILEGSDVNYTKLTNYLNQELDKIAISTEEELIYLLDLLNDVQQFVSVDYSLISARISHEGVKNISLRGLSSDAIENSDLQLLTALRGIDFVQSYVAVSDQQTMGKMYPYQMVVASLASTESVENLGIATDRTIENVNNLYSTYLTPEFHPASPYTWSPIMNFTWRGEQYSLNFDIDLQLTSKNDLMFNVISNTLQFTFKINSSETVFYNTNPNLELSNETGHQIASLGSHSIQSQIFSSGITLSGVFDTSILVYGKDNTITCTFDQPYLDPVAYSFRYEYQNATNTNLTALLDWNPEINDTWGISNIIPSNISSITEDDGSNSTPPSGDTDSSEESFLGGIYSVITSNFISLGAFSGATVIMGKYAAYKKKILKFKPDGAGDR
jgi:hypothetical protein